jgi:hypothetical protein
MKKSAITLIFVLILLVTTQLACSIGDVLGGGGEDQASQLPLAAGENHSQGPAGQEASQNSPSEESSSSPAQENSCLNTFSGSSNIPDGSEYQAGDSIEASFTLVNTGDCLWDTSYSLAMVGGDLTPTSEILPIAGEVAPGESIMVGVEFSAPSQDGIYLSVWKMENGQGAVFGMENPQDAPLRIKIRVVTSGSPQPTPSPTPNSQASGDQFTMLADQCFDFNSDSVVDCSDGSADFKYNPDHPILGELARYNDNTFGEYHSTEPSMTTCQNDSFGPMPKFIQENQYLCFRIETLASTTYGWMRVTNYNADGLTFDFDLIGSETPLVTAVPNTDLFVRDRIEHCLDNSLREPPLLVVVHHDDLLPVGSDLAKAEVFAKVNKIQYVFLETAAAKADRCLQELRSDSRIGTDRSRHLIDIGARCLAKG